MLPIIEFLGREISMYAVFATVGILVSGFAFCRYVDKKGYDDNDAIVFMLIVAAGVLLGGHILYTLTNLDKLYMLTEVKSFKEFLTTLSLVSGGSVFYGGLMGGILAGGIFIKLKRLPRDIYLDGCALLAPLFHGFARIGCFFAGCCYGIESEFGFAAQNNELTGIGSVRRFPVQLLESLENFTVALVMLLLIKKKKLGSYLFYIYLIIYSILRFINEFLRGDEIRGFVLGLSTSQFISIIIFAVVGAALIIKKQNRKRRK